TRNPPRDVMLAQAGTEMGRGWAFGINEALDQFGAFIGPLAVAAVLAKQGSYQSAFALLAIPAIVTLLLVFSARSVFPDAGQVERRSAPQATATYPAAFWWYLTAAALVGFGFADFSLVAYHFSKAQIVPASWIPIFYALAMAAGGIGALVFGKLFDRIGLIVLAPVTLIVAAYAPLAFLGGSRLALAGTLLWGIGLGAHESVMQAAVAHLVPHEKLGSAYGLFGAAFGVAWFAGSVVLGATYDASPAIAALVAAIAQLLALAPLAVAIRGFRVN
ncbi:MAG: MFS transporter, partial [Bradyrhizobium sp.]